MMSKCEISKWVAVIVYFLPLLASGTEADNLKDKKNCMAVTKAYLALKGMDQFQPGKDSDDPNVPNFEVNNGKVKLTCLLEPEGPQAVSCTDEKSLTAFELWYNYNQSEDYPDSSESNYTFCSLREFSVAPDDCAPMDFEDLTRWSVGLDGCGLYPVCFSNPVLQIRPDDCKKISGEDSKEYDGAIASAVKFCHRHRPRRKRAATESKDEVTSEQIAGFKKKIQNLCTQVGSKASHFVRGRVSGPAKGGASGDRKVLTEPGG